MNYTGQTNFVDMLDYYCNRNICNEREFNEREMLLWVRSELSHKQEQVDKLAHENVELERQLADLKERYECKADALNAALLTIDEYEKQLAEAKASAQAWHDNCNIMEAELDKERNKHAETVGKLAEARAELDRYKAGVEVEGLFDVQYGLNLCSSETHKLDNSVRYGKVRVLIMKLEG